MKALMVVEPGVVRVRDIPVPMIGPYDALCRTTYAGICSGTDIHVIEGSFGPNDYPLVLGHESVGEVLEVGEKVEMFRPGDLITRVAVPAADDGSFGLAWGGMSEYTIARDHRALQRDGYAESDWRPAQVNQVIRTNLPPHLMPLYITWRETFSYTRRLGVREGSRVVVSGSGANGLAIAAMARLLGAADITIVGSMGRARAAELAGATRLVAYTDGTAVSEFVAAYRNSVDLLVDATGIRHSLDALLPLLNPDGVVGVYGLDDIVSYALNPRGVVSFRYLDPGYDEAEVHDDIENAVRAGHLNAAAWVSDDRIFTWGNVHDAYAAAKDRTLVKPIIRIEKEEAR